MLASKRHSPEKNTYSRTICRCPIVSESDTKLNIAQNFPIAFAASATVGNISMKARYIRRINCCSEWSHVILRILYSFRYLRQSLAYKFLQLHSIYYDS